MLASGSRGAWVLAELGFDELVLPNECPLNLRHPLDTHDLARPLEQLVIVAR